MNGEDLVLARRHIIGQEEIKKMTVSMLVVSGTYSLCINESIQELHQLPVIEKRKTQMANGSIEEYDIVGPLEVKF